MTGAGRSAIHPVNGLAATVGSLVCVEQRTAVN